MKNILILGKIFVSLFVFVVIASPAIAQSAAATTMDSNYPGLMKIYGSQLEKQNAHYILGIDVSSSMQPYENVVKRNFQAFVKAIPDGDQVTLIRMAKEDYTDFVELFKCITINTDTRNSLLGVLNSSQFSFLKDGDARNGSDGYTLAKKVLEAVNTVGSNELTFIYLFTDFEYWTSRYHYDKNKEDWKALEGILSDERKIGICKYGLELNFNNPNLRKQAVFKSELDRIFGKVDYQAVSSAAVLEQWFAHTITHVMSAKINSMVKRDWNNLRDSLHLQLLEAGDQVRLETPALYSPLATGLKVSLKDAASCFHPQEEEAVHAFGEDIPLGEWINKDKALWPGFRHLGGEDITLNVHIDSPVEKEIRKLTAILGEKGSVEFSYPVSMQMPSHRIWDSVIPLWVWIVAGVLLAIILGSVIYTYCIMKVTRSWAITVKEKNADGMTRRYNGDTQKLPYTIGRNGVMKVPGANWDLTLLSKRCNPLLFGYKSGYYIRLENGTFAEIADAYSNETKQTLAVGGESFLFACGKPEALCILITYDRMTFTIELS